MPKWFNPNSAGPPRLRKELSIVAAQRTPGLMLDVIEHILDDKHRPPLDITEKKLAPELREECAFLASLFDQFGSDKSRRHNYHLVYGHILARLRNDLSILEVGLGSNNPGIVSNMGVGGQPGASLRAWMKARPEATVHGADIDDSIVVEGAKVFYIDQHDPNTFEVVYKHGQSRYDLIIDDGLHVPSANLLTMNFALSRLSQNGVFVVEDIPKRAIEIWNIISLVAKQSELDTMLVKTSRAYMFVCSYQSLSWLSE